MMRTVRIVFLSILVAGFFCCSGAFAQARSVHKIKVLTLLGRPLQFAAADKQGIFAKYGVEVETENLPNSDVVRANLAAGKGDLAYLAVDNAVATKSNRSAQRLRASRRCANTRNSPAPCSVRQRPSPRNMPVL